MVVQSNKKALKVLGIVIIVLVILGSCYAFFYFQMGKGINKEIIKEYGESISLSELMSDEKLSASTAIDLSTLKEVGNYKVKLKVNIFTYSVLVKIVDTTAPLIEVQDLEIYIDEELPMAEAFIVNVEDLSEYSVEPITIEKKLGSQTVNIVVTDKYGNQANMEATLNIIEDNEPPIFNGLSSLTIEVGEKVDLYTGVTAEDKRFGSVTFTVDDSGVNYQAPGTYTIYYEASDSLGNTAKEKRTITIIPKEVTYEISNFPTYSQYPNYPNGCESVALYNLLRFYNVNVTLDEIIEALPKGDTPYLEDGTLYGGNPEIEFVGDPRNLDGYGVYQKPIQTVANKFKAGMIDYTGHSLDSVLNLVQNGIPVQVWVSINLIDTEIYNSWIYKPTGERINWLGDLHSVVITGFSNHSVLVSDSFTGTIKRYDRTQFNKIYNLFGQRALYYPN